MAKLINGLGKRHGSVDRGGADSYYYREFSPHYYTGATYSSTKIPEALMTPEEISAYTKGYNENEMSGDKKDWGNMQTYQKIKFYKVGVG